MRLAEKLIGEQGAARQREQQRTVREGRARVQRPHGRANSLRIGSLGLGVLIVLALFVYYGRQQAASESGTAAAAILGPFTASSPSSPTGSYQRVSAPLRQSSRPVLMFIGAQYCPFCGAERWAIVKALSRFGVWSNLFPGHSSSGMGGFSSVPTFDLLHTRFTSKFVIFDHKDVADNAGNNLQALTSQEQKLFSTYDPAGSIPLVYVDGYAMTGSAYSPAELQGKSFAGVQRQLERNAPDTYVRDINTEANLLTGFLCKADANRPDSVCGIKVVQRIERTIQ